MVTSSPFSLPGGMPSIPPIPTLPPWLQDEARRRLVSLVNHVLMQEPEAVVRLQGHVGKSVLVQAQVFRQPIDLAVVVTPAGLIDVAPIEAAHALTLEVLPQSPLEIAHAVLAGKKPDVRIEGDIQFAGELQWLTEHVRWDMEEDLARLVGDVPARVVGDAMRTLVAAVRKFVRPT
jgi:ubiquinone biosynthesis accessory factor UbiJ